MNTEDKEDDFYELFELVPPTFSEACGQVESSFGLEGDPMTEKMCTIPLTARQVRYVNETLDHARQLHRSGDVEAAWYHYGCAKAAVAERNGFMEGRYQSSDAAGATRVAAHYCGVSVSQFNARAHEYDLDPRKFMGKKLYAKAALYRAIYGAKAWSRPSVTSAPTLAATSPEMKEALVRLQRYDERKGKR
ncbi:TPA: hypothetical protein ACKQDF_001138 [Stenotrophomonas maltophilia]